MTPLNFEICYVKSSSWKLSIDLSLLLGQISLHTCLELIFVKQDLLLMDYVFSVDDMFERSLQANHFSVGLSFFNVLCWPFLLFF